MSYRAHKKNHHGQLPFQSTIYHRFLLNLGCIKNLSLLVISATKWATDIIKKQKQYLCPFYMVQNQFSKLYISNFLAKTGWHTNSILLYSQLWVTFNKVHFLKQCLWRVDRYLVLIKMFCKSNTKKLFLSKESPL